MALYGHMNEFNSDYENIVDYLDRLSFKLEANRTTGGETKENHPIDCNWSCPV